MADTQYELFRDLDRRCVAGGLDEADCAEAVRMKRASIESEKIRSNPVAREVLDGKTTFVAVYDGFSREFRGLRRFIPHRHDPEKNERLRYLAEIVPNVRHFTRRSLVAMDNPVNGVIYGLLASVMLNTLFLRGDRSEALVAASEPIVSWQFILTLACAAAGFMAGVAAMLKYRTRDPQQIHAREAAAYMDLNYAYYRLGDDEAWARCIRVQGENAALTLARPDGED
ncbi:MAG: hypothetical protein D6781_01155 [Verrucomicrobia bacterium]|nr:MAG: hypothetical protein D6781_01155 [Verrucomicrobiota bacterium]